MVVVDRKAAFWWCYSRVYDLCWDTDVTNALALAVVELCDPTRPVIEVGAGTGLISIHLAEHRNLLRVHEPSAAMRRRLQARLPNVEVDAAGIYDLIPSTTGVTLVACNVLHLMDDPSDALRWLRQAAGRGGSVVVATPNVSSTVGHVASSLRRSGVSRPRVALFVVSHAWLMLLATVCSIRVNELETPAEAVCSPFPNPLYTLLLVPGLSSTGER